MKKLLLIPMFVQERRRRLDGERRAQAEIEQLKLELAALKKPPAVCETLILNYIYMI